VASPVEAAAAEPPPTIRPARPAGSGRLSELLPLVERRLPPALAGRLPRRRLRAAARHLPIDCLTALELRLGRPCSSPVDLSVRLDARAARGLSAAARPPHLARFIGRWAAGGWPAVRWLWLEYDLDGTLSAAARPPLPSAAAGLAPGAPDALTSGLFAALAGHPTPAARRARLRRCLEQLPAGARLLYVFAMSSRPGRPSRIEIGGLAFDQLRSYLGRVAGSEAASRSTGLEELCRGAEPHHLAIDVSDEVAPRFGIDCSFRRLPHRDERWRGLLDGLVAAGLCHPGEREALLAWTGYDTFRTGFADWPASADLSCAVVRALSHVKLVSTAGRPPEAKVYLMLQLTSGRT
jgi:hypothetical protein